MIHLYEANLKVSSFYIIHYSVKIKRQHSSLCRSSSNECLDTKVIPFCLYVVKNSHLYRDETAFDRGMIVVFINKQHLKKKPQKLTMRTNNFVQA